jgi:hypothetical protein
MLGVSEKIRLEHEFYHSVWSQYTCDSKYIEKAAKDAQHSDFGDEASRRLLFIKDDYVCDISWARGYISIKCSAKTHKLAKETLNEIKKQFPKSRAAAPDEVQISFWTRSSHGAQRINRKLVVPEWKDIKVNYNAKTSSELDRLMDKSFNPGIGGKLILWQGSPGTGKTTALRALTRNWKDWARCNYITDPEKFFGSDADYMFSVITDGSSEIFERTDNDKKKDKWNLLILEDCGEILASDARQQAGQGLSRFLNCVDGLIGQGLNIIVLVTTNEELTKLHPAVQRPGRTAARIEFDKLSPEEASQWLGDDVDKAMTIAELYAKREGFDNQDVKTSVGFS